MQRYNNHTVTVLENVTIYYSMIKLSLHVSYEVRLRSNPVAPVGAHISMYTALKISQWVLQKYQLQNYRIKYLRITAKTNLENYWQLLILSTKFYFSNKKRAFYLKQTEYIILCSFYYINI